ncbi:MAG TPA: phosphohistidine phosphatase SixA [Desulfobacteraceae bacterium]|mgnify:CR=1 FL=1|nr:phosphohistidine phosphatase SixA [Desulfobacteraceae bacterium]
MKLFLVQHGEANSKDEDPERSLTVEGIRKTKKIAVWLGHQHENIGQIHHSGKKRAAQTAEIFANRLAPGKGVAAFPGLNPNDDVSAYARQLEGQDEVLMVVGHLPFLDRLASLLVAGDPDRGVVAFANSGVVCLVGEDADWSVAWAVVPDLFVESP